MFVCVGKNGVEQVGGCEREMAERIKCYSDLGWKRRIEDLRVYKKKQKESFGS